MQYKYRVGTHDITFKQQLQLIYYFSFHKIQYDHFRPMIHFGDYEHDLRHLSGHHSLRWSTTSPHPHSVYTATVTVVQTGRCSILQCCFVFAALSARFLVRSSQYVHDLTSLHKTRNWRLLPITRFLHVPSLNNAELPIHGTEGRAFYPTILLPNYRARQAIPSDNTVNCLEGSTLQLVISCCASWNKKRSDIRRWQVRRSSPRQLWWFSASFLTTLMVVLSLFAVEKK